MKQKKITLGSLEITDRISPLLKTQVQIDINNLKSWRLTAPSRMLKKLNDEAVESDNRYRNIEKPFPLL